MSLAQASALARAVLYEGYVLYPYRASSLKNCAPCLLGGIVPKEATAGETRAFFELTCLVEGAEDARITATARFLQLACVERPESPPWHDSDERTVLLTASVESLLHDVSITHFTFEGALETREGATRRGARIQGQLVARADRVAPGLHRLFLRVENGVVLGPSNDVSLGTLAAAHALVEVEDGAFVSCVDPPEAFRDASALRPSIGVFPVLLGEPGSRDAIFASAFALGDHPSIAPESPFDFCDGAEMDEMLALRVRTMTEHEIAEARALDPRARAIVDRALALGDDALARLHGARRPPAFEASRPARAFAEGGRALSAGDRVRLRPNRRADVFDLALAGELATIASVEQDVDGRTFFAVTVDKDPGRDLGLTGMPGHRFFFRIDEVEPA